MPGAPARRDLYALRYSPAAHPNCTGVARSHARSVPTVSEENACASTSAAPAGKSGSSIETAKHGAASAADASSRPRACERDAACPLSTG